MRQTFTITQKLLIYVWQFRSCAQFRCRWQAIIREESRLQMLVSSGVT